MKNHNLIDADSNTHLKIAGVALVASIVFMAVVSLSGVARWENVAIHGPVVKATTSTTIAGGGLSTVR